ncbi:MAG: hypothetical protein IJM37_09625 [Lachnospiraceae bacterium]|nr:hypothetical protein [Lachnospiraceae bacterium]
MDLDIDEIKNKAKSFTPEKDKISALIQLCLCIFSIGFVLLHELNKKDSKKAKK